ncbi:MAG: excinuclease ABC subunit UvrB [Kiritimatiellales bacterium]|nr:excinuclease ABC subunit UvrB [Kiritimatiellales bacterium]
MDKTFQLVADFEPTGDQPEAINALCTGLAAGKKFQTLEGVTGSGKTFTIANVIAREGRPTLVLSHNKTLAAQLYAELKAFFPNNAVEFFISYYDYYQPEAYIPQTDTFIEKDSAINEEIERLRLAATDALLNRRDVIIVASVSCIYGLGSAEDYKAMVVSASVGESIRRDAILKKLVEIQYERNDYEPGPGRFRVRGDTLDIFPSYAKDHGIRIEFWGDEIDAIKKVDPLTGDTLDTYDHIMVSPAKHFVMPQPKIDAALVAIRQEMEVRVAEFERQNRLIEAQRIKMRTEYDLEMMKEIGFCGGIENYSRHLAGRQPGARPECLLDYFPDDFLMVVDESHVTLPQVRGMYNGDQARKGTLVEHGFRLPSALDNRPMNFDEFISVTNEIIFLSATPAAYEREHAGTPIEQIIRPTGIVDPPVEIRPLKNQIDDLMEEIRSRAERGERTLVTTLTKRTAEDLSEYLEKTGLKVQYLHSDIGALERVDILRELRGGKFDCLIGINLLREGLDLPEVSLVAILDADKEGFLRSETALVQTAGRAARHIDGRVIMYAERITDSMQRMIDKCEHRRQKQTAYNTEHGVVPRAIKKDIAASLKTIYETAEETLEAAVAEDGIEYSVSEIIHQLEQEMLEAAEALEFERAAILRDQIKDLKHSK